MQIDRPSIVEGGLAAAPGNAVASRGTVQPILVPVAAVVAGRIGIPDAQTPARQDLDPGRGFAHQPVPAEDQRSAAVGVEAIGRNAG